MKYKIPLLLFFLTFSLAYYFALLDFDPHHDGLMFKSALDLLNGKILFKETFTQYGAFTTILQSLSLFFLGPYLFSIKILTCLFYGLISSLLYLISKRFLKPILAVFSVLVWQLMAPYYEGILLSWSSVYSLFFILLSCYLILLFFEKNKPYYLFLSGISSALVFWTRQSVGPPFFAAIFLFLSILNFAYLPKKKNTLITFILGNLLVHFLFILWLLKKTAFHDWYLQSIIAAYVWGKQYGQAFDIKQLLKSLFPPSLSPLSVWCLLVIPALVYFLKFILNFPTKRKIPLPFLSLYLLSFASLASWLQYYPVTCNHHLYWASTPSFPLFTFFVLKISQKIVLGKKNALTTFFTIFALSLFFYKDVRQRINFIKIKTDTNYYTTSEVAFLKHLKSSKTTLAFFLESKKIIDQEKYTNKEIITTGTDALFLAFQSPRQKNFHPLFINWFWMLPVYPDYLPQLKNYITQQEPLIFSPLDQLQPGYCRITKTNLGNTILSVPCPKQ